MADDRGPLSPSQSLAWLFVIMVVLAVIVALIVIAILIGRLPV